LPSEIVVYENEDQYGNDYKEKGDQAGGEVKQASYIERRKPETRSEQHCEYFYHITSPPFPERRAIITIPLQFRSKAYLNSLCREHLLEIFTAKRKLLAWTLTTERITLVAFHCQNWSNLSGILYSCGLQNQRNSLLLALLQRLYARSLEKGQLTLGPNCF
jgi:hypothetical protein